MRLKPYTKYKPSGVEWLGAVPEAWDVKPIKSFASFNDDTLEENTDPDLEIQYVDISSIDASVGITSKEQMLFRNAPSRARRKVQDGDVIVSTVRTYLRAIARIQNPEPNLVVSTGFAVIRPRKDFVPSFAGYLLTASYVIEDVIARSTGVSYPAINASELVRIKVAVPPPTEQSAIAAFLDRETAKIDTLIAKQEKLIELLKEERQAIISHAVTKGLNQNVKMKDSGIEWLGAIPEHWRLYPTKRLFSLVTEPAPDNNDEELLSIYTDIGVRPRKSLEAKGNRASTTDGYWIVRKGDIIVNKLLAWMGAIGLSEYDGVTSPAYDILRQTKPLNPKYYDYLFRCGILLTEFRRYSRGIMDMRLRLYFEELGQIAIPYPPESEQSMIVDYLHQQSLRIDNLISKAEKAITLQKEHRAALISAAVTGKIDVREAA